MILNSRFTLFSHNHGSGNWLYLKGNCIFTSMFMEEGYVHVFFDTAHCEGDWVCPTGFATSPNKKDFLNCNPVLFWWSWGNNKHVRNHSKPRLESFKSIRCTGWDAIFPLFSWGRQYRLFWESLFTHQDFKGRQFTIRMTMQLQPPLLQNSNQDTKFCEMKRKCFMEGIWPNQAAQFIQDIYDKLRQIDDKLLASTVLLQLVAIIILSHQRGLFPLPGFQWQIKV